MRRAVLVWLGMSVAGCAGVRGLRPAVEPSAVDVAREDSARWHRIGIVDRREVGLDRLRVRVSEGRRCPRRTLPTTDSGVVSASAADRAGCRLYPYSGPLPIYAVKGEAPVKVITLHTDRRGHVDLDFGRVDAALRALGLGGVDDYDRLIVGTDAWAGTVDLVRLRAFLADWHFTWVSRGRGSPALFAIRHPEHAKSAEAKSLAVEARVSRQRADYARVRSGEMSPTTFLQRHAWSPFRHAVEQLLTATPSARAGEPTPLAGPE